MLKYIYSVLMSLLIPSVLSAGITDASDYLEKNVTVKKLKNGITLIMLNRGVSPTLAFEISFRVGSADESYNTIGAAHLLEHMLFKGTEKTGTRDFKKEKVIMDKIEILGEKIDRLRLSNPSNPNIAKLQKELTKLQEAQNEFIVPSPYDRIYASNGGVGFNASTSKDETGYYIELPASKIELWAKIESERLKGPVLREFYIERNNVVEERLMRYDSSGTGVLFEQFLAQAFSAHPYRHPTIGWASNIPNLSIKDIRKFFNDYYIPERMTITIVGRQNTNETLKIMNKYFGDIPKKQNPSEIPVVEPVQNGERRFTVFHESNPLIMMGWHKPAFPAKDDYVFDILSDIISSGKSSPLYKSLVIDKKAFTSISSWNGMPGVRYNNMFMIYGSPRPHISAAEAEKMIYDEMDKIINNLNNDDLAKIRIKIESETVFSLDTNKGIARMLSYYQTIFHDWKYLLSFIKAANEITVDDIKKVSAKYMTEKNRVVGILADSRKEVKSDSKK